MQERDEAADESPEDQQGAGGATASSARWVALAKVGRVHEALEGVETADLSEPAKQEVRIQILHQSGDSEGAAKLVREHLEQTTMEVAGATYFATIAYGGGDLVLASALISVAVGHVEEESELRALLDMATEMREADLVGQVRSRLGEFFPQSEGLDVNCEARLLQICEPNADDGEAKPVTILLSQCALQHNLPNA